MSNFDANLQATRSPHAIALLANAAFIIGTLIALTVFELASSDALMAAAAIPLFGALAVYIRLSLLSICPSCGKLPTKKHWGRDYIVFSAARRRFWPEKICSRCDYDLTKVPADG